MTRIFITGDRTEGPRMITPIALRMLKELNLDPEITFVTSTQTGIENFVNLIAADAGVKLDTVTSLDDHAAAAAACDKVLFFHVAPDESGWYPELVTAAGEDKVELVLQQQLLDAMVGPLSED